MAARDMENLAGELLALLPRSPDACLHKVDFVGMAALLVELDAGTYRASSFLDDRILGPRIRGTWLPLEQIEEASRGIPGMHPLHFIFHAGHVGSTLLSRLLDETGQVLSLREPLPLRTLADTSDILAQPDSLLSAAQFDLAMAMFLRLWRRGYDTTHSVILKATSSAARLGAALLERSPASRAILLNLRPETFLATLLAGQNSHIDLRGHGPERMRRLNARLNLSIAPLHALSPGELAAMSWLAESLTHRDIRKGFPDRVVALDFDALLGNVEEQLARVLGHFNLPGGAENASRLARSEALTRYAKAPETGYSPAIRAGILRDSMRDNRGEIRRGTAWLERAAGSDPDAAGVISGAG